MEKIVIAEEAVQLDRSGKRGIVDSMGRASASYTQKPPIIVSAFKKTEQSLYVYGLLDAKECMFTIDTGASLSIVRPDAIQKKRKPTEKKVVLETATGHTAPILGVVDAQIQIGFHVFDQQFLVADILDECILGLNFMNTTEFILDVPRKLLKIDNEEILLNHSKLERLQRTRVMVAENTFLPSGSEMTIWVQPEAVTETLDTGIFEADNFRTDGVLVARCLVSLNEKLPVRVANTTDAKIMLKKGELLGYYEPVVCITKIDEPVKRQPEVRRKLNSKVITLMTRNLHHLTPTQRKKVEDLIVNHQGLFAMEKFTGRTNIIQHRINTGDAAPVRQAPRRLPFAKRDEVESMINNMIREDVIEESASPWSSPVVLVTKKDGSTRFCVDYRRLNEVTKKDSFPLPRIDDTLHMLAESQWFSTLDLKSGYWQVEMQEDDKEKTAFSVGNELYQFKVLLPFGLCNATASFSRLMSLVLKGLLMITYGTYRRYSPG